MVRPITLIEQSVNQSRYTLIEQSDAESQYFSTPTPHGISSPDKPVFIAFALVAQPIKCCDIELVSKHLISYLCGDMW